MVAFMPSATLPRNCVDRATAIVRSEASRRVRLGHIPAAEQDDLAQDLLVAVTVRWKRFNPTRAGLSTFLALVIRCEAISLMRMRNSAMRGSGRMPVSLDCIQAVGANRLVAGAANCGSAQMDLGIDIRELVEQLPADLQRTARALMSMGPSAASRFLGIPRHVVVAHVKRIREHFIASGLTP